MKDLTNEEIENLPAMLKEEKERRNFEKVSKIPKVIIEDLQKQLTKILELTKYAQPEVRVIKFKIRAYIYYLIENEIMIDVKHDDPRHIDIENELDSLMISKSVKIKRNKIQKMWDELSNTIKFLSKQYKVEIDEIWEMVDKDGVL